MIDSRIQLILGRLQDELHYRFNDPGLLLLAITHVSFAKESPDWKAHYERLEWLGDSVLSLVITSELERRYPHEEEGSLSILRATLIEEKSLLKVGERLQLFARMRVGRGHGHDPTLVRNHSMVADCVEAIFGAVFRDGGYDAARQVILSVFEQRLTNLDLPELREVAEDFKTRVSEAYALQFKRFPTYEEVSRSGPDHTPTFEVQVSFNGEALAVGSGSSKKLASQAAARKVWEAYLKSGTLPTSRLIEE